MHKQVQAFIDQHQLIKPGQKVLLAVSGGLDSMAMLHLLARLNHAHAVAHVNFQLRGADSDEDEAFVKEKAEQLNLPVHTNRFNTAEYAHKEGISIQMAARQLRYQWFDELCTEYGYDLIATAHHANDQAETMLLNLVKETGIRGLRGMRPMVGNRIRPLLFAKRAEIGAFAKENSIAFRKDVSNETIEYERNYIRIQVIPALEKLNPNLLESLSKSANHLQFAEDLFLERLAHYRRKLLVPHGKDMHIPLRLLNSYPHPSQLLFELIGDKGFKHGQILDLLALPIVSSGQQFTSSTHRLIKHRHVAILTALQSKEATYIQIQPGDKRVDLADGILQMEELDNPASIRFSKESCVATVDLNMLDFPLVVRRWKKGDYLYPLGMTKPHSDKVGKKKLSDLFTDLKLSQADKERAWVLVSGKKIVWVVNHRLDDRFKITPQTRQALRIRFSPKPT